MKPIPLAQTIGCSCRCKMLFNDDGAGFVTEVKWCDTHEKMASELRKILDGFDLVLSGIAKKEERLT